MCSSYASANISSRLKQEIELRGEPKVRAKRASVRHQQHYGTPELDAKDSAGSLHTADAIMTGPAMDGTPIPVAVSIVPKRVLFALLAVISVLLLGAAVDAIATFGFGFETGRSTIRRHFELSAENNIPTYFSALQLLTAAALLGVIARHQAATRSPWRWHFLSLAVGFAFLSLDEAASIHETVLGRVGRFVLDDAFAFTWLGPGIVIGALTGLFYLRFLMALPRRFGRLFVISGAIFLAGAIGAEWIGSEIFRRWGFNWGHQIEVIVEEGLEMVGIAVFIYALLLYIAENRIALSIRVKA